MIQMANDRLRAVAQARAEKAAPKHMSFDWDKLWVSMGALFIMSGLCCFTIVGANFKPPKRKSI